MSFSSSFLSNLRFVHLAAILKESAEVVPRRSFHFTLSHPANEPLLAAQRFGAMGFQDLVYPLHVINAGNDAGADNHVLQDEVGK